MRRFLKWLWLPVVVVVAVVVIALVALTGSGKAKKHHTAWRALRNCLEAQPHISVAVTSGGLRYVVSSPSHQTVAKVHKYKDAAHASRHAAAIKNATAVGKIAYQITPHATAAEAAAVRTCAQRAYGR